jgi:hypothetical protein
MNAGESFTEINATLNASGYLPDGIAASIESLQFSGSGLSGLDALGEVIQMVGPEVQKMLNGHQSEATRQTRTASLRSITTSAESAAHMMNAAEQAAFKTIGLYGGLQAILKLFPFAVALLSATIKGQSLYKKAIVAADILQDPRDFAVFERYISIITCCSVSVIAVPLLCIPIFIYQSLAAVYFVLVPIGIGLWLFAFGWMSTMPGVQLQRFDEAFLTCGRGMAKNASPDAWKPQAIFSLGTTLLLAGIVLELTLGNLSPKIVGDGLSIARMFVEFVLGILLGNIVFLHATARVFAWIFSSFQGVLHDNSHGGNLAGNKKGQQPTPSRLVELSALFAPPEQS